MLLLLCQNPSFCCLKGCQHQIQDGIHDGHPFLPSDLLSLPTNTPGLCSSGQQTPQCMLGSSLLYPICPHALLSRSCMPYHFHSSLGHPMTAGRVIFVTCNSDHATPQHEISQNGSSLLLGKKPKSLEWFLRLWASLLLGHTSPLPGSDHPSL